jgi:hypothetical protein
MTPLESVKSILTPVLALILWSFVMWIWMYVTRIPAITKAGIDPDQAREPSSLDILPLKVRQVAYNYNHLMEQPTIFYALVFYTYLTHRWVSDLDLALAWAYVALRVVHSLIQATINAVMIRFSVHVLGTLVLMALAAHDVWRLLG